MDDSLPRINRLQIGWKNVVAEDVSVNRVLADSRRHATEFRRMTEPGRVDDARLRHVFSQQLLPQLNIVPCVIKHQPRGAGEHVSIAALGEDFPRDFLVQSFAFHQRSVLGDETTHENRSRGNAANKVEQLVESFVGHFLESLHQLDHDNPADSSAVDRQHSQVIGLEWIAVAEES